MNYAFKQMELNKQIGAIRLEEKLGERLFQYDGKTFETNSKFTQS